MFAIATVAISAALVAIQETQIPSEICVHVGGNMYQ